MDTQNSKGVLTLVPDNSKFAELDRLLEEVKSYSYMEDKYANDDDANIRQIIREFSIIKEEKEADLEGLIKEAYSNGSLIYLYNEDLLNVDTFKGIVNDLQRKLIKNIYTKRLTRQLPEDIGIKLLKESHSDRLQRFFGSKDFYFFDANGNFVGEHLKVVEEINTLINNKYIDGKSLEEILASVPWGYSYGTISTTLAALFRAGRLVVRYNDTEYFSYTDTPAHEVFISSMKFKTARFKSITRTLDTNQKNQLVQTLLDLEFEKFTKTKISWSASDFEAANAITQLAEYFIGSLNTLKSTQTDFNKLFANVAKQKDVLQEYTSKTTESNYIQKAEDFLAKKEEYCEAIKAVIKAEKFIKKNLDKIKGFRRFVEAVNNELDKAGIFNTEVEEHAKAFEKAISSDVIQNYVEIQSSAQAIKDIYFNLMSTNAQKMKELYSIQLSDIENTIADLNNNYPAELNKESAKKLYSLKAYCKTKIVDKVSLEYHTTCQISKYSLTDILNYIALANSKQTELEIIKSGFLKEAPKPETPGQPKHPKKMKLSISKKVMKASEYRKILAAQIQAMAGMADDDEIEVDFNN
jgi:hypothetical protein